MTGPKCEKALPALPEGPFRLTKAAPGYTDDSIRIWTRSMQSAQESALRPSMAWLLEIRENMAGIISCPSSFVN
jgi:hypothetical protein